MATACETLIEEFVALLETPRPLPRYRAGFRLVRAVWARRARMHEYDALDVSGFRRELVENGQNGEAVRHFRLHAGCILLGVFGWPLTAAMDFIDQLQARSGRPESLTEMRDNVAGREVGHHLIAAFSHGDRDRLRHHLHTELAGPGA